MCLPIQWGKKSLTKLNIDVAIQSLRTYLIHDFVETAKSTIVH